MWRRNHRKMVLVPAEKDDQDDTDSDDSCDSFPHDGSFKMMALSPKSSSVKVLEGTNVDDLLESLQDSTGTIRKEVDISYTYEHNNTGSHSDWKNGKAFSSQENVREI